MEYINASADFPLFDIFHLPFFAVLTELMSACYANLHLHLGLFFVSVATGNRIHVSY